MNQLHRQVQRAYWRLFWTRLTGSLTWTLFATFSVALIAVAIPKIWPLAVDGTTWTIAWLAGAAVLGVTSAIAWTVFFRPTELQAAIEIDLRYGLKERVSSALALTPTEQETDVGAALLRDANQCVERIDVRERFRPRRTWHPLLPILTAAAAFLVATFVPDTTPDQNQASAATAAQVNEQVRKSMQELKKRLAEKRKQDPSTKLAEADELITKFEKAVKSLESSEVDRKKALVQLNNLSKQMSDERDKLSSSEKTRDQLRQLKNIENGPADRISSALQKGDMQMAMDELRKLSDKLNSDSLSAKEKEQLQNQLQQLAKEIEKMLAAKQELANKQQELKEKIDELKKKGDLAAAGQMQQKLDQLQQQMDALEKQNPQMQNLEKLAQQLKDCAKCAQDGEGKKAAQQLADMAKDLQQLQQQMENLKTVDDMMQEIADAKNAMNCKKCDGEGCEECQGNGQGNMQGGDSNRFSEKPGRGLGPGRGMGDRPEEETPTGGYRTRVSADPKPGEAVRVGDADGPNVAGKAREEIKKAIAGETSEDPDPLSQQTLPRHEREQTKEYFERLRQGR